MDTFNSHISMHIDEATMNELKQKLIEEKARLESELRNLGSEGKGPDAAFKDVGDDEDENAQEVTAYQEDLSLEKGLEETLEQVDAALARIEQGTYGMSEVSGEPIPVERLKALPWATKLVNE